MTTSLISDDVQRMYADYLQAYYEYTGHIGRALYLPSFTKRIQAGKIVKIGKHEFMSNATFKEWINNNLKKHK